MYRWVNIPQLDLHFSKLHRSFENCMNISLLIRLSNGVIVELYKFPENDKWLQRYYLDQDW